MSCANYRANRRRSRRNYAIVRSYHARVTQANAAVVAHCLSSIEPCLSGFGGGHILIDLLHRHRAGFLQGSSARSVGLRLRERGFCLGNTGVLLGEIALNTFGCKGREHLTAFDIVTDVHTNVVQAQAVGFSAHNGFLPGRDIAVGCELERPIGLRCACRRNG